MLKACPVPGKAKSAMLVDAFIAGAPRDGIGNVFYGVKQGNHADWLNAQRQHRSYGRDFYVIDNSYFNASRGTMFRVAKNALQHTGMGETTGYRFDQLGVPVHLMQEWCALGVALVVEQSVDHMRYTVGDEFALARLLKTVDYQLHWRHWSANKPKIQATLADDLRDAKVLITHTSAAAVEAVLAGVPVICDEQCAAHPTHWARGTTSRLQWAGVLADNQFTLNELKDGTAWRKLNL